MQFKIKVHGTMESQYIFIMKAMLKRLTLASMLILTF